MNLKDKLKFLPAAMLGVLLLASCKSTTFKVPEMGTRFENSKEDMVYDRALNAYIIPFDGIKKIDYGKFDVILPHDDQVRYFAPAGENSVNHATFYVRNLPVETDFFGRAIYMPVLEGWKSLDDIRRFYREKYTPDKYTISLDTRISKFCGCNCVEYDIVARLPETGKVISVHGYCMFDPNNPSCFFDVGAGRTAYEKDIDDDFLIKASGLFFDSIRFNP